MFNSFQHTDIECFLLRARRHNNEQNTVSLPSQSPQFTGGHTKLNTELKYNVLSTVRREKNRMLSEHIKQAANTNFGDVKKVSWKKNI